MACAPGVFLALRCPPTKKSEELPLAGLERATKYRERSDSLRGGLHKGWFEAKVGAVEESGELGKPEGQAFGGSSAEGDVAKFAPGTWNFPVKV